MPRRELRHLLQMVHFAMAQQDIRFYLNGLLLVLSRTGIAQQSPPTATGWHSARMPPAPPIADAEVIMPRKTVTELLRLLGDSEEPVHGAGARPSAPGRLRRGRDS